MSKPDSKLYPSAAFNKKANFTASQTFSNFSEVLDADGDGVACNAASAMSLPPFLLHLLFSAPGLLFWAHSEVGPQHLRTSGHSVTGRCFVGKHYCQATA